MSRPRVFISSTYFDLKHVRSSLEAFIGTLGFDAVLSEKGKIAFSPDLPLDESCYKEVESSDILVLLIGGRYGADASPHTERFTKDFFTRYNSITRKEYSAARDNGVPIYILIERAVYAEYETFLRNRTNKDIVYAHVESVNVFELIDDIVSQPKNNPIFQFDRQAEIESWLREQWAGLFRELLQRMHSQEQISSLQSQVTQLSEINTTLKRYLEKVISSVAPDASKALIEDEEKRLDEVRIDREISENSLGRHLLRDKNLSVQRLRECLSSAKSISSFLELLAAAPGVESTTSSFSDDESTQTALANQVNKLREIVGLKALT